MIDAFEVEPSRQEELVELLRQATEQVMRHVPGFVSSSIHRSLDGKRVVNYAQWETLPKLEQMPSYPGARTHMEKAAKVATSSSSAVCEVAQTFGAPRHGHP